MAEASPRRALILGTAGHIDHGKTALIEALTGTNTDRLAEERRRGISIELGFAELELPGGRRLGVVDVPGHERLVRTMVAGASGFDLCLMVIAADDGVMPQTREHAVVLRALGDPAAVVALTKADRADPETRQLAREGASELLPDAPVVEVSAVTGEGLDDLREELERVAEEVEARRRAEEAWPPAPPVLHVDRAFSLRGIGTVVTGTLWSGEIARGDRVEVLPARRPARVRSVEIHGRGRERARAGERTALNLAGIDRGDVQRGDAIVPSGSPLRPTYRLDVELRLEPGVGELGGERVQVHHGTRDVPARVIALGDGLAQLRLEAPVIARGGDAIVLRRIAPPDTLGGGRVLDQAPQRHGPGSAAERLELIHSGTAEALLERALAEAPAGIAADPAAWSGAPLLAAALGRHPRERWEQAVERSLAGGVAEVRGGRLFPPGPAEVEAAGAEPVELDDGDLELLELLSGDGVEPRAPAALAQSWGRPREQTVAALERLAAAGKAVRVKPGVYYERSALESARERIVELAGADRSISIAELRDALGTSRKYAQALLEHLDATRVTVRHGDRHVVRSRA